MRNPRGYATIVDPDLGVQEFDTITCAHCGSVTMSQTTINSTPQVMVYRADGTHYMKDAGFCRACFAHICPRCNGKECSNRFKRLDQEEALMRKLAAINGINYRSSPTGY